MIIRKLSLICAIMAMAIALSSCLGEPKDKRSYTISVSNMIIPDDINEPVTFNHGCSYNLSVDGVKNTLTVGTNELSLNGRDLSFTTNAMDLFEVAFGGGLSGTFARGEARLSNGQEVTRLYGFYTSMNYYVDLLNDPFRCMVPNPMLVMSYRIGDAIVKTFSMNPYFKGTTTTSYAMGGQDKTFSYGDATYRVNFADDMKSANVIIYNIKFAQEMPRALTAVILRDVKVNVGHEGYVLEASDVIPEVLEGGGITPNPSYKFTSFSLRTTSSDLVSAECEYVVNGVFKGQFAGSYCAYYQPTGN